jgi:hypothetical protein
VNERIKELAAQVEKYISTTNFEGMPEDEMTYDEIFQKKFAELIVRDIAAVLRESAKHQSATGSESDAYILRSHASGIEFRYGIKE